MPRPSLLVRRFSSSIRSAPMPECKMSQGSDGCTFKARTGPVTLSVDGTVGSVLIQKAKYNGVDIANLPARTMTFTIVAGKTDLVVVYVFSDRDNGAGVLNEVCDGN